MIRVLPAGLVVLAAFGLPHLWITAPWLPRADAATLGTLIAGTVLALARWCGGRAASWIACLIWAAGCAALAGGCPLAGAAGIGTPVVLMLIHAGLRRDRPALLRAAAAAGAPPWMAVRDLLLPLMAPGIAAAAVLVHAALLLLVLRPGIR